MTGMERHDRMTIVSMAVVASGLATLLHEGVGHGVTAWLRGDIPTMLTSNHLSSMRADRMVDAGGTVVNLIVGGVCLWLARAGVWRPNTRYLLWVLGALNLLPGAGYFLFSGILGVGDWHAFTFGWPHQVWIRVGMTVFGATLYVLVVRLLATLVRPFVPDPQAYDTVGKLPYFVAGIFSCVAGSLDPLGWRLLVLSTIPAAFGGSSGLLWADSLMPPAGPGGGLLVRRSHGWWVSAALFGILYVVLLGRGIPLMAER